VAGRPIPSPETPMTRQTAPVSRSSPPLTDSPKCRCGVFVNPLRRGMRAFTKTCLPYFKAKVFPFRTIGETALDEFAVLFQRDFRCRCQQQMRVIGHDHKFMQQKPLLLAIPARTSTRKLSHAIGLKNARGVRRSSRSRKNVRVDGSLRFSPGAKQAAEKRRNGERRP